MGPGLAWPISLLLLLLSVLYRWVRGSRGQFPCHHAAVTGAMCVFFGALVQGCVGPGHYVCSACFFGALVQHACSSTFVLVPHNLELRFFAIELVPLAGFVFQFSSFLVIPPRAPVFQFSSFPVDSPARSTPPVFRFSSFPVHPPRALPFSRFPVFQFSSLIPRALPFSRFPVFPLSPLSSSFPVFQFSRSPPPLC